MVVAAHTWMSDLTLVHKVGKNVAVSVMAVLVVAQVVNAVVVASAYEINVFGTGCKDEISLVHHATLCFYLEER